MNREILFKAKRKDNGKWVEGYYCKTTIGNDVRPSDLIFVPFKVSRNEEWGWMKVDFDTICQYTGLTDKNGKKIWENDICDRKEKYPEIVVFNEGDWQLDYSYVFEKEIHSDACNLGFYVCERNCVEVVGNIFDNPELLEVE